MKKYYTLLAVLTISMASFGQSQVLEAYVTEGISSNLTLQQHDFDVKKSQERLNQAKALFLPQISFDASYTRAGGGRSIDFPVGDLLNPVYSALNQMSGSEQFPTIDNVNEQFLPNDFHDTKIRLIQPLFNSDIYFASKAQERMVSVEEARKQTFVNELRYDIEAAYYTHLSAVEAVKIFEQLAEVLKELVRVNKSLVANDKATYDVIYTAEAELSQLQSEIIGAQKNVRVSQSYFNFLLNRELEAAIEIDESVKNNRFVFTLPGQLSADAFVNRQELEQVNRAIDANQYLVKLNKNNAYLPNMNLVVDAGYQGFGYSFDSNQDYWLAQVSLSWNLFKGGAKKSKIKESEYELERLNSQYEQLRDQIQLQVINAYSEYLAATESVEAARSGELSAQKSFHIIDKKYRESQVILVEFLDAHNKHRNAQLNRSIAEYNALAKAAELRKVIGNK